MAKTETLESLKLELSKVRSKSSETEKRESDLRKKIEELEKAEAEQKEKLLNEEAEKRAVKYPWIRKTDLGRERIPGKKGYEFRDRTVLDAVKETMAIEKYFARFTFIKSVITGWNAEKGSGFDTFSVFFELKTSAKIPVEEMCMFIGYITGGYTNAPYPWSTYNPKPDRFSLETINGKKYFEIWWD